MTRKSILICTYSAGYGHHRAAEAVKDAFLSINPAAGVYIIDPFAIGRPHLNSLIILCYLQLLKRAPIIYRLLYEKAETSKDGKTLSFFWRILIDRSFCQLLNELILRIKPDIILCAHPFSAIAMRIWKDSVATHRPAITGLLTDYTVHPFWWQLDLDGYFVGSRELVRDLANHGIAVSRIWPVGIPVDPEAGSHHDKSGIRRKLGLNPAIPTILIMGGGLGLGGLDKIVRCLGTMEQDIQLLVVTGANLAVQNSLTRMITGMNTPVKVFGFIHNVPELMGAADLIVTKPGGITVAEALAAGLPMIIWKPIPGQEVRNTSFLVRNNLAVLVQDPEELVPAVRLALGEKQTTWLELSLANRSAARNIADIMTKTWIN